MTRSRPYSVCQNNVPIKITPPAMPVIPPTMAVRKAETVSIKEVKAESGIESIAAAVASLFRKGQLLTKAKGYPIVQINDPMC